MKVPPGLVRFSSLTAVAAITSIPAGRRTRLAAEAYQSLRVLGHVCGEEPARGVF